MNRADMLREVKQERPKQIWDIHDKIVCQYIEDLEEDRVTLRLSSVGIRDDRVSFHGRFKID